MEVHTLATPEFTTEELASEIWKAVPGWEMFYSVSNLGRVRRDAANPINGWGAGRLLNPSDDGKGYLHLVLSRKGARLDTHAYRLVALAFIGPLPKGFHVDHIDANKQNDRLGNLEYVPERENHRRAAVMGLYASGDQNGSRSCPDRRPKGTGHWKARLTEDDVREIRAAYTGKRGELTILAKKFQVRAQTIQRIITRRLWKHI